MKKKREAFDAWVSRNGGEVLAVTNSYEVARFRAFGQPMVVYTSTNGRRRSFSCPKAGEIFAAYENGVDVALGVKTAYRGPRKSEVNAILERDGKECFYCGVSLSDKIPPTIEHMVARNHGGPDHISNKFLSCQKCNTKAGHLSAPEKIRIRESAIMKMIDDLRRSFGVAA